jgi:hypothetical protein
VILFLWAEGVLGAEMHRRISVQYGNSVVSQWMVYEWIERSLIELRCFLCGLGNISCGVTVVFKGLNLQFICYFKMDK